jgi:hypothetical protein
MEISPRRYLQIDVICDPLSIRFCRRCRKRVAGRISLRCRGFDATVAGQAQDIHLVLFDLGAT